MSSGVLTKVPIALPQHPLAPAQALQLTACSAASVLPGSPPHRNSSPAAMDDDASGSSNFGTENEIHVGQQNQHPQQQSFCLKWNNYQSNVTTTFKELLAEEDFVDITLTADGGALKAHKVFILRYYFTIRRHNLVEKKIIKYDNVFYIGGTIGMFPVFSGHIAWHFSMAASCYRFEGRSIQRSTGKY